MDEKKSRSREVIRCTITLPKFVGDVLDQEAFKKGVRLPTLCSIILSDKAHEMIEEKEKKVNEGR